MKPCSRQALTFERQPQIMKLNNTVVWDNLKNKPANHLSKYRVRQRGCSLTHSARTPPAVHQGITIWVDEIEFEKK